jgi:sugar O-acyltransferase (sialic acid O-acetyltransferase NeuD family)
MEKVVIYGAGGLGCLVQDILQQAGRFRPVGFLDSNPATHGATIGGLPVTGGLDQIGPLQAGGIYRCIVAIGDNTARVAVAEELRRRGMKLVSAIHPLATISPSAKVGEHVIIGPRATVGVHTRIGAHTMLSAGAIADHDNTLGTGVFLEPAVRLAGTVTVEDLAHIGIGAAIIPGRTVGRGARVEAGAVVIDDVAPDAVVGGIPAVPRCPARSHFVPQPAGSA